jgi:hypothetical protein
MQRRKLSTETSSILGVSLSLSFYCWNILCFYKKTICNKVKANAVCVECKKLLDTSDNGHHGRKGTHSQFKMHSFFFTVGARSK